MASNIPLDDTTTLVITRHLKAPRELVWKMFSDPYHLAQWWGPKGFTNRVEHFDLCDGGEWRNIMIAPDGMQLPLSYTFLEVTPPSCLVYRNADADPAIFGDHPPPAFTTTIRLEPAAGGTHFTLVAQFDRPEHKLAVTERGFTIGFNQSLDRLAALLES